MIEKEFHKEQKGRGDISFSEREKNQSYPAAWSGGPINFSKN